MRSLRALEIKLALRSRRSHFDASKHQATTISSSSTLNHSLSFDTNAMSSSFIENFKSVLKKALALNSKPTEESFPELPEVLVWLRFLLAVAYGAFLGIKDVRSGTMPLQALNLIAFVPVMYCRFYLGAGAEVFPTQVIFSGLFNALALCVLIWLYYFTLHHEEEEAKLSSFLVFTSEDLEPSPLEDAGGAAQTDAPVDEPEF